MLSPMLQDAYQRAESRADQDGYKVAPVGYVLAEIVDQSIRLDTLYNVDLSVFADSDELRADCRPGVTVSQVEAQKQRILADATVLANREATQEVTARHYVIATALSPGDQVPSLHGDRLLLARAAGWSRQQGLSTRMVMRDASQAVRGSFVSDKKSVRLASGAFSSFRGFRRQYLVAGETLALLPGLLVREAIWTVLAVLDRNQRWAVSWLGNDGPSQLRDDIGTRRRASLEAVTGLVQFVLGVLAAVSLEVPTRLLGIGTPLVELDISSDESFIATSLLSGHGPFGLGYWVPWTLLAVAIPTFENVVRMRWGYRLHGGLLLRPWLATMYGVASITRPLDRALGAIGMPTTLARGVIVIFVVTLGVRAFSAGFLE